MNVLLEHTTAEVIEKKSRFIANVFYVENVEDAEEKLTCIKKEHYDAKHNCFAYVIGKNAETLKSSDDGEPSGTAGHPMLDIIKGSELTNVIAIVTRYFGGTLLGTGGLVRCYSDSLKKALENAKISEIKNGYEVEFDINYDWYGKIENLIQNINQEVINIYSIDKIFKENISLKLLINENVFDRFDKEIINISKGAIKVSKDHLRNYYINDRPIFI